MEDPKLAKRPDRTPVKITIGITPALNQSLADHATLCARTYGSDEPVAELIPAMLGAFLESDKALFRWRREASGGMNRRPDSPVLPDFITVEEFAGLARLSRRQIDRLRKRRPEAFPREYELGSGLSKFRSCPRFKRSEVDAWLNSRALF